ncbi:MAG: GTPase HflX [Spirochaetes bacterium GWF1_41_5]|nr:MAG: GTPase HflX [Spirochaetes bacterium GWF1_41_5]
MQTKTNCILAGVFSSPGSVCEEELSLNELSRLADTLGCTVKQQILCRCAFINPATYISSGNIAKIKKIIDETPAIVIFNLELTPSQINKLGQALETEVLTRTDVIIKIFNLHARSHEAKLQVSLAEMQMEMSRLKGKWTHFSRIEGGIGFRGPGQKQITLDRMLIKKEMTKIRKKLSEIETSGHIQSRKRRMEKNIAVLGYTNAGKSTLITALSRKPAVSADQLFTTLDVLSRKVYIDGENYIISDTVGFIDRLPHYLVASFRSTLQEIKNADLLLIVLDAADPGASRHLETISKTLQEMEIPENKRLLVINKIDTAPPDQTIVLRLLDNSICVSARKQINLEELKIKIRNFFHAA